MSVFDRRYEMMPRAELEQLQLERLQALLVRVRRSVRRYRERLADIRVETLADVAQLPVTTPDDMVEAFPYGMFALPLREVIRLHSTMGPDGRPLVIGHTRNDLAQWGRLAARQFAAGGVTANDVIQVCLGEGLQRGTSGYELGAEQIQAPVIAEDPFHIDYQLAMLQNYRPTMLVTTPTNAIELVRMMEQRKIDPPSLNLRTVLLSRPVDDETRDQIRAGLLVAVKCNFGVDEVLNPGLCVECESGQFHVNEDHFLVETHSGELIVTTLGREAMPLLRYATRVSCEIVHEKCSCGRTGAILKPGPRLDRRLRVREMSVYEEQIAEVLNQMLPAERPFRIDVLERQVLISVQMTADIFTDTVWPIANLQREIESEVLARLGIDAEVRFRQTCPLTQP
ncbi:MAG TPA: hypothetical protein PLO37_17085 [Candidatus Hydrogenedentes bacterium]|nr:hypothetical protein [Candidatus Hydrogenedentota bacterium]